MAFVVLLVPTEATATRQQEVAGQSPYQNCQIKALDCLEEREYIKYMGWYLQYIFLS